MKDLLFVYGTLHPSCAPGVLSDVVDRMQLVGPATVRGTLYNLGRFPGLVLDGRGEVHGFVFQLPDDPSAIVRLDRYEGYEAGATTECLFARVRCVAATQDGSAVDAWVYVYQRPPGGAEIIASGNWLETRRRTLSI